MYMSALPKKNHSLHKVHQLAHQVALICFVLFCDARGWVVLSSLGTFQWEASVLLRGGFANFANLGPSANGEGGLLHYWYILVGWYNCHLGLNIIPTHISAPFRSLNENYYFSGMLNCSFAKNLKSCLTFVPIFLSHSEGASRFQGR